MKELILFSIILTLVITCIIIGEIKHRKAIKKSKSECKENIYVTWSQEDKF